MKNNKHYECELSNTFCVDILQNKMSIIMIEMIKGNMTEVHLGEILYTSVDTHLSKSTPRCIPQRCKLLKF